MTPLERKQALKDELVAALVAALDAARLAHMSAIEGATHDQARAESDKDTRGLEQSYLARGQAMRIAQAESDLAGVAALTLRPFAADTPVALGAVVVVEEEGARHRFFIVNHGGGILLAAGDVQVVTPRSPLGRALVGKRVGDDCAIRLPGRTRDLTLIAIE